MLLLLSKPLIICTVKAPCTVKRSSNASVGIETRLRAGRSRFQIVVGATDFSLLQNIQTGAGAHTASYSLGTGVLSRG